MILNARFGDVNETLQFRISDDSAVADRTDVRRVRRQYARRTTFEKRFLIEATLTRAVRRVVRDVIN